MSEATPAVVTATSALANAAAPQAGTPVAAQVVARRGREALLLSVAAWVERSRPWRRTAPGFPD